MNRSNIKRFRDIPNVGAATENDFFTIGLKKPMELVGKDPYKLFSDLCHATQTQHDPCVIDIFISAVRYMQGEPAKKWWEYTRERKQHMGNGQ